MVKYLIVVVNNVRVFVKFLEIKLILVESLGIVEVWEVFINFW